MKHLKGKDYEKYRKIYAKEGKLKKRSFEKSMRYGENKKLDEKWLMYGHRNSGIEEILTIASITPMAQSILDVGCGWNEWKHLARASWVRNVNIDAPNCLIEMSRIPIYGVDIACPGADIIAPAKDIPLKDKSFDLIVSFDCLEHIPEEEISKSIQEFARIGNRAYMNICLSESLTTIDNEPLHVCIESKEWWLEKFKEHFKYAAILKEYNVKTDHWTIIIYADHTEFSLG